MKAILVLDEMPKNCGSCPLFDINFDYDFPWTCLPERADTAKDIKPRWCPLKELPEYLEIGGPYDYRNREFSKGWNECLLEITEDEDGY